MATTQPAQSFLERNYFLIRRLHSLCGIVPIGAFLIFHLSANASVLLGPEVFEKNVEPIGAMPLPLLVPLEMTFIFLPLAFHAILGVVIWRTAQNNVSAYHYPSNVRYVLQRITGIIALVFILFHVWSLHWLGAWLCGGWYDHTRAFDSTVQTIERWWFVRPLYALGITCSVYHLANGVWTSLITWGITTGPNAQRKAGYVCAVFGVILGLVGLGALRGFSSTAGEKADHVTQAQDGNTTIAQRDGG